MAQTLVVMTPEELEALVERGVRRALEASTAGEQRPIPPAKARPRARPKYNPAPTVPVDEVSRARARRALRRHGL